VVCQESFFFHTTKKFENKKLKGRRTAGNDNSRSETAICGKKEKKTPVDKIHHITRAEKKSITQKREQNRKRSTLLE